MYQKLSENLTVEQPYLKDVIHPVDKYMIKFSREVADIIGFNEFRSSLYPDDLDTMVHEFNEMFFYKFPEFRRDITFNLFGEDFCVPVAHVLSSLVGGATLNAMPVSPDDVDKYLIINCKMSAERWRKKHERNREESSNRIQS